MCKLPILFLIHSASFLNRIINIVANFWKRIFEENRFFAKNKKPLDRKKGKKKNSKGMSWWTSLSLTIRSCSWNTKRMLLTPQHCNELTRVLSFLLLLSSFPAIPTRIPVHVTALRQTRGLRSTFSRHVFINRSRTRHTLIQMQLGSDREKTVDSHLLRDSSFRWISPQKKKTSSSVFASDWIYVTFVCT